MALHTLCPFCNVGILSICNYSEELNQVASLYSAGFLFSYLHSLMAIMLVFAIVHKGLPLELSGCTNCSSSRYSLQYT
nr:MAG TPA: hypothetical protein [Caudoviricetes sp.]